MTTATDRLYAALARIFNADASKNNGLFMGEAVLCHAFSLEAADALIAAGGTATAAGYFGERQRLIETKPIKALQLALDCLRYCRAAHKDAQRGDGLPAEVIIEGAIEQAEAQASAAAEMLDALRKATAWAESLGMKDGNPYCPEVDSMRAAIKRAEEASR